MRRPSAPVRSWGRGPAVRVAVQVVTVCAAAAVGWVLVQYAVKSPWHHYFDLGIYRAAITWWLDGKPLYSFPRPHARYGFTYPPFAALLLAPLAAVSQHVAGILHTAACAVVAAGTTWWLVAPVARRAGWSPWFAVGIALPVVLVSDPVRETMGWGQVDLFIAALVLVDVAAVRRGRWWAGAGVGLAAAVKLTPAVFVLYLALTRRWRAAAVAVGTFGGAAGLGFAVAPRDSLQFWGSALWETARVGPPAETGNQSVLGMLARLALPGQPSRPAWLLLAGGVLIVALARAVRASGQGDELAGFTLTGLAGCLVSPISWSHHLYWVVAAAVVLLDVAAGRPLAGAGRRFLRHRERAAAVGAAVGVGTMIAVFCSGTIWIAQAACGGRNCSDPTGALGEDSYGLLMVVLLFLLPVRAPGAAPGEGPGQERPGGTWRRANSSATSTCRMVSSTTSDPWPASKR